MNKRRLPELDRLKHSKKSAAGRSGNRTEESNAATSPPVLYGKTRQQLTEEVAGRIVEIFGTNEAAAARRLNTVTATVKTYTDKKRIPATEMLIRIVEATGVSLDWLLLGKGEKFSMEKKERIFSIEELERISLVAAGRNCSIEETIRTFTLAQLARPGKLIE